MTIKRATVRLFVAVTGLLASLFELAGAFVRLVTACTARLERRVNRSPVAAIETGRLATAPTVLAEVPARPQAGPQAGPMATLAMTGDERLTSALMSLKFPAARVRMFTASVCGRQDPLEVLVKEGIVALSSPAVLS